MRELVSRVRAHLRRSGMTVPEAARPNGASRLSGGPIQLDPERHEVFVGGGLIQLTPKEYDLLVHLMRNAGKVLTHRQLLSEVWGPNATEQAHYLRVYMAHLRRKLETDAARPRYLLTEAGVGYRLAAE